MKINLNSSVYIGFVKVAISMFMVLISPDGEVLDREHYRQVVLVLCF
jgi:hypothetical protein